MYNAKLLNGETVYIACSDDQGDIYCQVYTDENLSNEVDNFVIHADDLKDSSVADLILESLPCGAKLTISPIDAECTAEKRIEKLSVINHVLETADNILRQNVIGFIETKYDIDETDLDKYEKWYDAEYNNFQLDIVSKIKDACEVILNN